MAHETLFVLVLLVLIVPVMTFSQTQNSDIANLVSAAYSSKSFATAPVNPKDLELILRCGVRAPSARNSQPWHFTVIRDVETMKKIVPDTLKGNILIIVSGLDQAIAPPPSPSTVPWRPRTCTWPPNPWAWVRTSILGRSRISTRDTGTPLGFRPATSAWRY